MSYQPVDDLRIESLRPLISPAILMEDFPITEDASNLIADSRQAAERIIRGEDDRLMVITGPCSIHDPVSALEYARRLRSIAPSYAKELMIIMRVYFEKPRTTIGWKGLINDPNLDNTYQINKGLRTARRLLLDVADLGLPAATEFLDTIIPQFIADLISWGAIGARTTESQIHRELASGLSMPVGFKNGTTGNTQMAIDALRSSLHPHCFLSVTKQGNSAIVTTKGNDSCHIILRGGSRTGTNYQREHVESVAAQLAKHDLHTRIMVDCSHGNSEKDHRRQAAVAADLAGQISGGSPHVCGVMIESHLVEGRQDQVEGQPLVFGQSITDACVSWEQTIPMLDQLAEAVRARRNAGA
jgi:3-deoxy-7-phosphoheptulonate synthase